jgi:transposase-like protein
LASLGQVVDTGGMSKIREERREFWRQLIVKQQQSGVAVRALCREHGASEHSFYQWRKRLARQLPVKFALVETDPGARVHTGTVEVILPSGERLRITPGADAATLRLVLNLLREPR